MQLFFHGLSEDIEEKDIIPLLSGVVSLGSVRVIRDVVSGKSRGFALVTIKDEIEGQKTIERLNGTVLKGTKLAVLKIHDTLPGEMEFREWLSSNAGEVLRKVGVSQSQTIVDYGCGPGIFSLAAATIVGLYGKVYALDVRSKALEEMKEKAVKDGLTNLETILIDKSSVKVTLDDRNVDVVLLYDVLQEVPDKTGLLAELHRILKPDGFLSVFPMHLGTEKLLDIVNNAGLFQVRDRFGYSGLESASEIVNLIKRKH
jgi:2-polyprenyl-3-methyl-5-hydroxy-6-metoxy-1,4-benzoquinol methylase